MFLADTLHRGCFHTIRKAFAHPSDKMVSLSPQNTSTANVTSRKILARDKAGTVSRRSSNSRHFGDSEMVVSSDGRVKNQEIVTFSISCTLRSACNHLVVWSSQAVLSQFCQWRFTRGNWTSRRWERCSVEKKFLSQRSSAIKKVSP